MLCLVLMCDRNECRGLLLTSHPRHPAGRHTAIPLPNSPPPLKFANFLDPLFPIPNPLPAAPQATVRGNAFAIVPAFPEARIPPPFQLTLRCPRKPLCVVATPAPSSPPPPEPSLPNTLCRRPPGSRARQRLCHFPRLRLEEPGYRSDGGAPAGGLWPVHPTGVCDVGEAGGNPLQGTRLEAEQSHPCG